MNRPKSLLNVVGIGLGSLGIVLCVAAIVILWIASTRLGHVTEHLFGKMGTTLSTVGQRVAQTQERVAAARISTEEITGTLRDWAKREVGQRVAERLNAAEKSERLASIIEQADNWLEVAESSVGLVQDMLSINASSGAPSETTPIDQLLSEITSLRGQLAGATKIIADIHDRLAEAND